MAIADPRPPPLVLLIHDQMSVAHIVRYLGASGLRVTNRANDAGMLRAVVDIGPDLIVLDFAVNSDTVQRLKADVRTQHIPVIALADVVGLASESSP